MIDAANTPIFWQDGCLPAPYSLLNFEDGLLPTTDLYLNYAFWYDDRRLLKGRTLKGEYLTVHDSKAYCVNHHQVTHIFDCANGEPIADPMLHDHFESCITRVCLMDGFVGDRYIEDENPHIDKVVFESSDLALLSKVVFLEEGNCPSRTLFENCFVEIQYVRGCSESNNLFYDGKEYHYSIVFDFKQSIRLSEAMRIWVRPIINLLMIVLMGDVVEDDIVFYSRGTGAEFRWLARSSPKRDEGNKPCVSHMLFCFCDITEALQAAIIAWMERPNTLCGASKLYPYARYRTLLGETRFSMAMRLIEAVYADTAISGLCQSLNIPLATNGIIVLDSADMQPVSTELRKLSNGNIHPFTAKVKALGERFDQVYTMYGKAPINWEECAKDCKNIRNAEAHGTLLNGQDRAEYDKQFALEQMGLLMYEMAVLDLFPVGEKMISDARRRLYEAHEKNVTIADYWSAPRVGKLTCDIRR